MAETTYEERTDSVEEKLRLLRQAYGQGKYDVAMSLSESLKETLDFERQTQRDCDADLLVAPSVRVERLPAPWVRWATGWSFCKILQLEERAGLARSGEPVDLGMDFAAAETTDLGRELRVALLDASGTTLREIPSQVYAEWRRGERRGCRLLFLADVPARGRNHYFVFHGNVNAECPEYLSDLQVDGTGYGLDIANNHFTAHLSQQIGQLQSLDFRRGFGEVPYGANLELHTGGEGHGEPPNIDWGPDYTGADNYQKFRITAWPRCPNFEVVRGPLCVSVRRWGFPQSAVHPLYTPSRMHMDITYTFYSGQPHFIKEVRMEAVKSFELNHVRDDEWLFWGRPFTDPLWIDREGRLHEGEIPESEMEDLWASGFFNSQSRDAFIALRLEHHAEKFGPRNSGRIHHDGAPSVSYYGRGQVWCRSPVHGPLQLKAGTAFIQRNAYLATHYPEADGPGIVEAARQRLLAPLTASASRTPRPAKARADGSLARSGEAGLGKQGNAAVDLKRKVWEALRTVRDDQLMAADGNVADLGLIRDLRVSGQTVYIVMNMPHAGRTAHQFLANPIRNCVLQVDGVSECVVECSWEPGWNPARINDAGRKALQLSF